MNNNVIAELHKLAPSAIIELFKLELFQDIHGVSTSYYFHAGVNEKDDPGDLVWIDPDDINEQSPSPVDYVRFPVEATGFEYTGQGTLPRPTIRVSNVFSIMSAVLSDVNRDVPGNDLCGAKLTRIRTLAKFLPAANFQGGSNPYGNPDVTAILPLEVYYVDRKVSENRDLVEFELVSSLDLAGVRAPKRLCIANLCPWKYRGAECGYTGTLYFNENDEQVANSTDDICGKRLSSCVLRFGTAIKQGQVTNNSTTMKLLEPTQGITMGMLVDGFGIPANTTVTNIVNQGSTETVSAYSTQAGQDVTITATAGYIFTSIVFASYGTPTGTAPNFVFGACHAERSLEIVSEKLIGANSATFTYPFNNLFGDPCKGTTKNLAIVAIASQVGTITLSQAANLTSNEYSRTGTIRKTAPILDVTSATNIRPGMKVTGRYLPASTTVVQVNGTAIELSTRPYIIQRTGKVDISDPDDQSITLSDTSDLSVNMFVFGELLDEDADSKNTAAIQQVVAADEFWTKNSDTGVFQPVGKFNAYKTNKASWDGTEVTLGVTETETFTTDTVATPAGTSNIVVQIKASNVASDNFRANADTTGVFSRNNNVQIGYVGGQEIQLGVTPQTLSFGTSFSKQIAIYQFWTRPTISGLFVPNGQAASATVKRRWEGANVTFGTTGKGNKKNGYEKGNFRETFEDAVGNKWDGYEVVQWVNGNKTTKYGEATGSVLKNPMTVGSSSTATLYNGYEAGDKVEDFTDVSGDKYVGWRLIYYVNYVTDWDSLTSEGKKTYQATYNRGQGTRTVTYIIRAQRIVSISKDGYEKGAEKEKFMDADGNNWRGFEIKKWTSGTVATNYQLTKSSDNSLTRSAKITAISNNKFIRLNGYGLLQHGTEQSFYFVPVTPAQETYTFKAPSTYRFGQTTNKVPFGSFPGIGAYQ